MAQNKKEDAKKAKAEKAKTQKNEKSNKNIQKAKAKKAKAPKKGKDGKAAKPGLWTRFVTYCKAVKSEMQRVVWPTRQELVSASIIVVGALIFFGVLIAIVDNLIIIPLDAISSLGA